MTNSPVILLVDDEPALHFLISRLCQRLGAAAFTTDDGQEALQWLAQNRPAVALIDLNMNKMSGPELLDAIEVLPLTQRPPVLIITGQRLDAGSIARWPDCLAGILYKPVDLYEFERQLRHYLSKVPP